MRRLFLLLGLIGLVAAPALADVTIRYKVKDQPGKAITLSVADHGNARFDSGDGTVLIVRDGTRYFVTPDRQGPIVGRVEDGIVVVTEFVAALMQTMAQAAASQTQSGQVQAGTGGLAQLRAMAATPYTVHVLGNETVGGRAGTRYVVAAVEAGADRPSLEVVIATDPDLAPAAREVRGLVGLAMQPAAAFLGQAPDLLVELDGLLARGLPIRIGEHFRLESVSTDPMAQSSFELPGPVLTLEQLRVRSPLNALGAGQSAAAPEPDAPAAPEPDDE